MKQVFTISIDEELVKRIRHTARDSQFKNKSHLVEQAIKEFLEDCR
ncbi:ribbon-helix-helix domain-containing protein [Candidatus Woesearchaeota archaeon]|jgi:metal-responsive CopG/Arc/MetJ family transcriptional regulator|nr:ribbon-helix-helix domain-containing protein [Candidatus Woesearchaeota archaeon]